MDIIELANTQVATLTTLTTDAVKRAEAGDSPAIKLGRSVSNLLTSLTSMTDDEMSALFAAGVRVNAIDEAKRSLSTLSDEVKTAGGGTDDRTEGDKIARWLLASVEGAMIDGEAREAAEAAVEAWTATEPKRATRNIGASSTSTSFGPLGFTVEAACTRCAFKASTTRDNLNSIRDQIKRHESDKHETNKDAMAKGTPAHEHYTQALNDVMHGATSTAADIDGWAIRSMGKVVTKATQAPAPDASTDATQAA